MNILGITDSHDAAACLICDGHLVGAVQEERFTRIKSWVGFPEKSISWLLRQYQLEPQDIDFIAFHGNTITPHNLVKHTDKLMRQANHPLIPILWQLTKIADIYPHSFPHIIQKQRIHSLKTVGLATRPVTFVEHHAAHAATAYFGVQRKAGEKILVLTCDGRGDRMSASVNIADNKQINCIAAVHHSASLGFFYALITLFLGMKPLEHEYKVMGLAPYAPTAEAEMLASNFKKLFQFDNRNGLTWKRAAGVPDWRIGIRFLKDFLDGKRFDVIAGGLQLFLEDWLCAWVKQCIKATGIRNIALSGGVFMNVKANQAIAAIPEVENLFVFPSPGDATGAIGAAWYVHSKQTGQMPSPLKNLYLGPEYSNSEILAAIQSEEDYSFEWCMLDNTNRTIANLLKDGHIVARFNGRMEFGARALGNRSILADPTQPDVIKTLNMLIKNRDFWMPFAPAILDTYEATYLVNPKRISAPYMAITFDTTDRRKDLQAAIHPYDCTTRPQIISKESSPQFYNLVEEFEAITNRGGILNTSYNLHGEPIVCSPEDAISTFKRSGLKFLAIGDYLIYKK